MTREEIRNRLNAICPPENALGPIKHVRAIDANVLESTVLEIAEYIGRHGVLL